MSEEEKKKHTLSHEVREKTGGYLIAALGFVAGLAWNDAIRSLIDALFPVRKDSLPVKFLYAIIVTIVVVALGTVVMKYFKDNSDKS